MIEGYIKIAKKIKERDNPRTIGACKGIVRNTSPYIVSILGDEHLLTEGENLTVCYGAAGALEGEEVLCVPEDNQNLFYAVARIRR